jgi:hypothetical protein
VTTTILFIGSILLILGVGGLAYLIKSSSGKRQRGRAGGPAVEEQPKNIEPVTLDRSPEMPHRPGATS